MISKQTVMSILWAFKTPLIAGNSLRFSNYNVVGDDKRECLKILNIGQSAAKILFENNVQRLSERSRV